MRRAALACSALLMLLCAPLAWPATLLQFDIWMRAADRKTVSVQRAIAAGDLDAAEADARELQRLYQLMQDYFEQDYPAEDAARMSREGRDLAALIPGALARRDLDAAVQAARGISLACNDCHDLYRPLPSR